MKKLIAMIGLAAMAGCATRQAVELEERDDRLLGMMRLEAKHARLKSVLGIDDAVLADTNKFVLGECSYSQKFKLDKPIGGFIEARVYLDKMGDSPFCTTDGKPHRLRSVELKRRFPDDATEKDIVSEWQSASDFIADILEVESPKVRLVDVEKWRKGVEGSHGFGFVRSCMTFELADGQDIEVRLAEPSYVMRDGKAVVAQSGYVEIDLTFNRRLCYGGVRKIDEKEKVEKEIDFGLDCRDKLAKALRDGIERQTQRAKRKPARGKEKKGDEKNVGASTNTASTAKAQSTNNKENTK